MLEEGKYNTLFKKGVNISERAKLDQQFTTAFAEVVQFLWKCKRGQSVRPGNMWNTLRKCVYDTLFEQLGSTAFHDSHEFFHFVIETVHRSLIQDVDMKIILPPPSSPQEALVHRALESWQVQFSKEYSPLIHMFYGLFHQKTTCQGCKNVSHRWEPFNSLKVPIPSDGDSAEPFDLIEALKKELSEEELIEEYVCESCGPPRKAAKKTMSIWKLPTVVVLNLKRFDNSSKKTMKPLKPMSQFPIDLASVFSEDSPEGKAVTHYTVRGVVDHHGNQFAGHYTAQCKNPSSGQWAIFDDEAVTEIPAPTFGSSTYIVFMERVLH
jgi:ubiquitin C-terminal hydrolase